MEREVSFTSKDFRTYCELVMRQQEREVKIFNRATIEILSLAGIKPSVFNQSIELFLITSHNSMLKSAKLSLMTPFKVAKEFEFYTYATAK